MKLFVEILALLLLGVIVVMYMRSSVRRTWDLMSWRNLFLLGFIHFYCLSAYFTASETSLPEYLNLSVGGWASLAITMVLFLALFMAAARYGIRHPKLTRLIPKFELPVTAPALVTCTLALSVLGL